MHDSSVPAAHPAPGDTLAGAEIVFLSWRDTRNPEGGGAERYLEQMAAGLVARGARVTIFCAAHAAAPAEEVVDGIRFVRRGGKLSVYPQALRALRRGDLGRPDVVVDVQNGLPFCSRLATRAAVVVLVHHVHREQWPVVYPGVTGRVGWWVERRLAPWLYRREQYVAVSRATRAELRDLGVTGDRVAVVHNGTDPALPTTHRRSATPLLTTVGRLVPHKQVEHAIDTAVALRATHPGLRLRVVGSGWWEQELRAHAAAADPDGEVVVFEGQVDEQRKHDLYAEAWLQLLPSLKEGWGLVVGEAGMHGTPTVAYADAGGTRESIEHDVSGLLVGSESDFRDAVAALLDDDERRAKLADGAERVSHTFTWEHAQESFAVVLREVLAGHRVAAQDPVEEPVEEPGEDLGA